MWTPIVIMQDGELVPFAEARIHPLSVSFAYSTTVFEGLRAYRNRETGTLALFRAGDHFRRLAAGMKLMRLERTFDEAYLSGCLSRLITANQPDDDVYVRLLVYIDRIGPIATTGPVGFTAAAVPREPAKYAQTGMSLGFSSWTRLSDNASPPRIKTTANYHNSRLAQLQARADGYDGALMLTAHGKVSEAPTACVFFVRDGRLFTPGTSSDILESITRDTVIRLYSQIYGLPVIEREVDRSEVYLADEAFICGTGQEIVPVVSIDRIPVGDGRIGAVTERIRQRYFDVVRGHTSDFAEWRTVIQ